jgi:osmoprotectant transport system permease protein
VTGGQRDRVTEGFVPVWQYIDDRRVQILINAWNHAYLVVLAIILGTVIAIAIAMVVTRVPKLEPAVNALSAIGLTIPSFALIGLLLPVTGLGAPTALLAVTFYAALPILRNAVVGLAGVDANLVESARGLGMSELASMFRIRLPLAWPVILAGIRVSMQMSMGIAAIAAYVLGPGLGVSIFTGLAQIGGKNAVNSALVGTLGIVVIALFLDLLLLALGRVTTSKGIRV